MTTGDSIFVGKGAGPAALSLKAANRHGLIAGATGTGKTVTLQILAEGFSRAGVPVFLADVKGDLAGLSRSGEPLKAPLVERARLIGLSPYEGEAFPTRFWDLYGAQGHPVRATISEMGPLLLGRLLDLNETQEGVLVLAFRYADDEKLLLLDLKDLRALLAEIASRASELNARYGMVAGSSIGAIQRKLLAFEQQGAEKFFGEPALDILDLLQPDDRGRGVVNILAADKLMESPKLYSTFLLWLLSELFEELPEIGDAGKPKLVFFFDEAHLLFDEIPKAVLEKIEQVVRLIRSRGVGVFFVTQNPMDVPDSVSGQLGNRVLHALRAFTPAERKVIKAAAETFRPNPAFSAFDAVTELKTGEALVSTLDDKGAPSVVDRVLIRPPSSRLGAVTPEERAATMQQSPLGSKYDREVDRQSAFEILQQRAERGSEKTVAPKKPSPRPQRRSTRQSYGEAAAKSALRTLSSGLARELVRGLLGTLRRR